MILKVFLMKSMKKVDKERCFDHSIQFQFQYQYEYDINININI